MPKARTQWYEFTFHHLETDDWIGWRIEAPDLHAAIEAAMARVHMAQSLPASARIIRVDRVNGPFGHEEWIRCIPTR